jgi:hydroxymethylpyrimidine pyrophosphatase-like HAD family hydrolase
MRRIDDVQSLLYTRERVFAERQHPLADAYALDDGLSYEVVPTLDILLDEDPHKLLIIGPSERVDTLQGTVRRAGLPVHAVPSEPVYREILPPGVSKGAALRAMITTLGVPAVATIAVGDNWNDLEMIEAAGLGVAMGSAPEGSAPARTTCAAPRKKKGAVRSSIGFCLATPDLRRALRGRVRRNLRGVQACGGLRASTMTS